MLEPWQKALLDTIAGPESAGRYNVIYGGRRFSDFSRHPGVDVPIASGPNVGKTSSAAGKYQFIRPTWESYQKKLGLPDFSPQSQDLAAWHLAADTYRAKTGQDLNKVLQSNDPNAIAGVGSALKGVWTSLPGGIEQGTNVNKFVSTYNAALGNPSATPAMTQAVADVAAEAAASQAAQAATQATTSQLAATQSLGPSPFSGLMGLIAASNSGPKHTQVNQDTSPGIGGNGQPIDPEAETIATSLTPDVYLRLRRRRA